MRIFLLYVLIMIVVGCNGQCDNNSIKNGTQIEYYKNKNKRSEVEVKNCLCSGTAKYYNPDETLHSSGQCIDGKYNGIWNFYDNDKNIVAQANWEMGNLVRYKILLRNRDSLIFDSRIKRLYNGKRDQINDSSILKIFNAATETKLINDSILIISDYRLFIVLTPKLIVKFNSDNITDKEFLEKYELRKINLELKDKFLRSGLDCRIKGDSVEIIVYHDDIANTQTGKTQFLFPFK